MKEAGEKISMLTAYDYFSAKLIDQAGVDIILVGDSLGMVIHGKENTLGVEMEDIIYHTKMVKRGSKRALITADLPFMSYQADIAEAVRNAGKAIKAGASAVKLEGGREITAAVKRIVDSGIPVVGHLGLTPQSLHSLGGFKVQGKKKEAALKLFEDALALQKAGVFALVLETIPAQLAELITEELEIAVIGIGAGDHCDGQVLVYHDLLGYDDQFKAKFVRRYADLNKIITEAVKNYINDLKEEKFPGEEESYYMEADIFKEVKKELKKNGDN
jgi:3-methyl-2-oxobutanoate hydroxymethyltransferase